METGNQTGVSGARGKCCWTIVAKIPYEPQIVLKCHEQLRSAAVPADQILITRNPGTPGSQELSITTLPCSYRNIEVFQRLIRGMMEKCQIRVNKYHRKQHSLVSGNG